MIKKEVNPSKLHDKGFILSKRGILGEDIDMKKRKYMRRGHQVLPENIML